MRNLSIVLLLFIFTISTFAQSSDEFKERREKIQKQLPDKSIVLLLASPYHPGVPYRQNSNFYYLSGWDQPGAILVLSKKFTILEVEPGSDNPGEQKKELEKIKKEMGFQMVLDKDRFNRFMSYLVRKTETVYTEISPTAPDEPLTENQQFLNKLKERAIHLDFKNVSGMLADMRVIHSEGEIALMKKAAEITDNAHLECMKAAAPGVFEYELEALCEYVYKRLGAKHNAFTCIIGSGKNGIELHYQENNAEMKAGDLVVMDIGAKYKMYNADITRTIPVSGKFSEKQALFYNIVLKAQLAAIDSVKPGVDFNHPDQVASKIMREELEKIGFIKKGDEIALKKYRKHSISHYLGLDTHDVGEWGSKLKPGMVMTIEPGIYIPEYGFGIRIEDDVLVTETGHEVLSNAPKTIKAIEDTMKKKGIASHPISDIKKR